MIFMDYYLDQGYLEYIDLLLYKLLKTWTQDIFKIIEIIELFGFY
jgi:hypothetical protein